MQCYENNEQIIRNATVIFQVDVDVSPIKNGRFVKALYNNMSVIRFDTVFFSE